MPRPYDQCGGGCGEDEFDGDSSYDEDPLADPEGPQARDLDDQEGETPTVPCPSCGAEVPDSADRCPSCGDWVIQGGATGFGHRGWRGLFFTVVAILLIIALLYWLW
jgi:hypothetical protein